MTEELDLKKYIREIPDFPKPGILFRDITPLLAEPKAFQEVIDRLTAYYRDKRITAVLAAEARGFIFAAPPGTCVRRPVHPHSQAGKASL